jgi:hypothetical protein
MIGSEIIVLPISGVKVWILFRRIPESKPVCAAWCPTTKAGTTMTTGSEITINNTISRVQGLVG